MKWLRSLFSSSKKFIGSDHLGNKYYEHVRTTGKLQRSVENNLPHEDYTSGQIPTEWDSWIRGRRDDPPTQEEVDKQLQYIYNIQRKAALKQIEDDARQEEAYRDGLIAREPSQRNTAVEEATARNPNVRANPNENEHASKGIVHEPDAWKPAEEKEEPRQVDAWTPGGKNN